MKVVLVSPEIPQNTGSIARMCAATGVRLHLVAPLGFSLDDRYLKRAGLDYWQDVCMGIHPDFDSFLASHDGGPVFLFSKKAERLYTDVTFDGSEALVFGSESVGLAQGLLEQYAHSALRIPIRPGVRSLNLSAAVHVVTYHALAGLGFPGIL
jgi:tRNA (cytidine/uridine-2'-O-)-methyltransferase